MSEQDERAAALRASLSKLAEDPTEATRIDSAIAGANEMFGNDLSLFEDEQWREATPTYEYRMAASEQIEAAWQDGKITIGRREDELDTVWGGVNNGVIADLLSGLPATESEK